MKDNATELDWLELSNSVDAILGLAFHCWIPPRVHQENLYSEIQSYSSSFQAHQEDPAVWVIGEGVYGSSLLGNVHGPIQLDTLDAGLPNHLKLFSTVDGEDRKGMQIINTYLLQGELNQIQE